MNKYFSFNTGGLTVKKPSVVTTAWFRFSLILAIFTMTAVVSFSQTIDTATIRGMGALAAPETYGHGGVGTSYCWADPQSGLSFAYITNNRVPDPWHSQRLDLISNYVHSAIV